MWLFPFKNRTGTDHDVNPPIVATPDRTDPVPVLSQINNLMPRKRGLIAWLWSVTGRHREPRMKTDPGGELQVMLPHQIQDRITSGDVCLISDSPYRIHKCRKSRFGDLKTYVKNFARKQIQGPKKKKFL